MLLFQLFFRQWLVSWISSSSFKAFHPTSSLSSTHHVEAAESELAARGPQKNPEEGKKKEKKALKKTELAKLCFKVGWHIRGTGGYSSAFFRDALDTLKLQHPKRSILFKVERDQTFTATLRGLIILWIANTELVSEEQRPTEASWVWKELNVTWFQLLFTFTLSADAIIYHNFDFLCPLRPWSLTLIELRQERKWKRN